MTYKSVSKSSPKLKVYVGGKLGTHSDLSALFTVRATHLYLRSAGRIAFVLPMAALTRGQFEPLRTGSFASVRIAWDEAWTMDSHVLPLFPVPSCVVFGRRRAVATPMPKTVRAYSGTLPFRDAPESTADQALRVIEGAPALTTAVFEGGSVYRKSFRQGATLVPRMLCLVERGMVGRLGADTSTPLVVSRRNTLEKKPWKDLPGIEQRVESDFLRPVLLGESILPYKIFRPFEGVVPLDRSGNILDANAAANLGLEGLHGWMHRAEAIWNGNANSEMTLAERWNFHNELGAQHPPRPLRVLYAKAGTLPAACLLEDPRMVVDHMLYWMTPSDRLEGQYLVAILNSETAREKAAKYQARGQFGARHFDKVVFNLPIPRFDRSNRLHVQLAMTAGRAERIAADFELPERVKFQRARGLVRAALEEAGVSQRIDELVTNLLDGE